MVRIELVSVNAPSVYIYMSTAFAHEYPLWSSCNTLYSHAHDYWEIEAQVPSAITFLHYLFHLAKYSAEYYSKYYQKTSDTMSDPCMSNRTPLCQRITRWCFWLKNHKRHRVLNPNCLTRGCCANISTCSRSTVFPASTYALQMMQSQQPSSLKTH